MYVYQLVRKVSLPVLAPASAPVPFKGQLLDSGRRERMAGESGVWMDIDGVLRVLGAAETS